MLLFLDTETTGLYQYKLRSDDPLQPKIVEIAALLCDKNGNEWGSFNVLLDYGIDIPVEATNVHGILREDCSKFGVLPHEAFKMLENLTSLSELIVGHNISFDLKVVKSAVGRDTFDGFYNEIPTYCTMLKSTNICKIPKKNGNKGNKWPNLQETYRSLFGKEMTGAHRAMSDVRACKEIYFKLVELL